MIRSQESVGGAVSHYVRLCSLLVIASCARQSAPVEIHASAATTLAQRHGQPVSMAIDARFVYWMERSDESHMTLWRVEKEGAPPRVLVDRIAQAWIPIVVDAERVYYSGAVNEHCLLYALPKDGGEAKAIASLGDNTGTLAAANDDGVYFAGEGSHQIVHISVGGARNVLATLHDPARGLALDDRFIYWLSAHWSDNYRKVDEAILRVARAGGEPSVIARGGGAKGIAVDDERVYWSGDGDYVFSAFKAGGPSTAIALPGAGCPRALASDGNTLFVAAGCDGQANGMIVAIPKSGRAAIAIAAGQQTPVAIAVDGAHVYWVNALGSSAVLRVGTGHP